MADLADVMDMLEKEARTALFPNGLGTPAITGRLLALAQGWPAGNDVDKQITQGGSLVSIYAEPSSTSPADTPINSFYTAQPATAGTTVLVSDPSISVGGVPVVGDVVVMKLDKTVLPYTVVAGDTPVNIAAALQTLALANNYPDATLDSLGTTLMVESAKTVFAGVSGVGTVAQKVHRQRVQFQIVVWAPTPADRTQLAAAIDVALKSQVRRQLKDGSSSILSYMGSNLRDKDEKQGVFRRDLLVNVTYETINFIKGQQIIVAPVATSITQGVFSDG